MKIFKCATLFIGSLFIQALVTSAQTQDRSATITVKMNQKWNKSGKELQTLMRFDDGDVWHKAIPILKNVPVGYDSVSQVAHYLDYDQVIYQAYKRGDMPFSFLQKVIQKWGVDTLKCTPRTITCFARAIVAIRGNDWYYILDEDANGDLQNDKPIKLTRTGNKLISNKKHNLIFEQFVDGKVQRGATQIIVTGASKAEGEFRRLHYQYLEKREGSFAWSNKKYELSLEANFNQFNYTENVEIRVKDLENGTVQGPFKKGDYFTLSNELLFVEEVKKDGSAITLSSMPARDNYQSLQKGFFAPIFSGATLNSETVSLADFKGSYTLIYFWNSSCAASTMRLESTINPILAKINGSSTKLKVLGVALDFPENVQSYIKAKKLGWPQIVASANGTIKRLYQISHYPTIYLIDPTGKVLENSLEFEKKSNLENALLSHLKLDKG
jgi:peroxiredoxin